MDDNRLKFGVGVLVIAAIGIGIILTFLFGAVPRILTGEYKLLVAFPAADGVSTNTKVLLRGVEIGRVINKQLRNDDVLLTLGIDTRYQENLTHEFLPRIGSGSFISGDSKLEFVKADENELQAIYQDRLEQVRNLNYTDEQFLTFGRKASDPFDLLFNLEDELRGTLQSVQNASQSLQNVGDNVNLMVTDARGVLGQADDQLAGIGEDARRVLIELQGAISDVREVVGNERVRQSLQAALEELPIVLQEAERTFQSTQRTFESFEKVGSQFEQVGEAAEKTVQNVDRTVDTVRDTVESAQRSFQSAEKTIENIEKITGPVAENSEELVAAALDGLRSLDRVMGEVEVFSAALNNSDGTIRRLLEDDDMYWKIRRTVENIEQATAKVRPILDDVRIFSDKIARDPRELGVRGALGKRPSGMGLK